MTSSPSGRDASTLIILSRPCTRSTRLASEDFILNLLTISNKFLKLIQNDVELPYIYLY